MSLRQAWVLAFVGCGEVTSVAPPGVAQPNPDRAFVWPGGPVPAIRVTPLKYDGEPVPCGNGDVTRPCDLEITGKGRLIERARSWAEVASVGPGLRVSPDEHGDVFALDTTGELSGLGPFHRPDAAQLLFCRLTAEPALHCHHELRPNVSNRVWNVDNCKEEFVARVDGAEIVASFPTAPGYTAKAARIDPMPTADAERGLALFLFALDAVYRDTQFHTPYVDHWSRR